MLKSRATVGRREVDLGRLSMPVMSVSAARDTIAPAEGVDAIVKVVPHAEVTRLPGGHVGIVAGRAAPALWQQTAEFLGKK